MDAADLIRAIDSNENFHNAAVRWAKETLEIEGFDTQQWDGRKDPVRWATVVGNDLLKAVMDQFRENEFGDVLAHCLVDHIDWAAVGAHYSALAIINWKKEGRS